MELKAALAKYSTMPMSTQVLLVLLKDYRRPYDKIMELVKQGYLMQLKKGLYVAGSKLSENTPEPFLIANHLYGPSYISLDSALFHWGMIPERVFEVTSVTTKPSKTIQTPGTRYSFTHLSADFYPLGIQSLALSDKQQVLIASPEKCLCDKLVTTRGINLRSIKQALTFLLEDLRIDKEIVVTLNTSEMKNWLSVSPKRNSIKVMINAIESI